MTISVANTANNATIFYLRDRVNELAYALSNFVLTTENQNTSGNCVITGTFTCNVLVANNLQIGGSLGTINCVGITANSLTVNSISVASLLTIGNSSVNVAVSSPNTAASSNGSYFLNANGSWSYISPSVAIGGRTPMSSSMTRTPSAAPPV